jgi:hypothetical protein
MTSGVLDILKQYQGNRDYKVRENLCNGLMALDSPEGKELLLEMGTNDPEERINTLAIKLLEQMEPDKLRPLHNVLGRQFDPSKGKTHIFNWFRSADVIAKATDTSLTSSLGNWWREMRATWLLNRRMLLSNESGHGILARLFNRYVWISALLALVATIAVFWLLIDNPYEDFYYSLTFAAIASILFGGMPISVLSTPKRVAFRKSCAGFVDALNILAFGIFCMLVPIYGFMTLIGEPVSPDVYAYMTFYLILPLILVRLSLIVTAGLTRTSLYVLVLCCIALAALVLTYGVELAFLEMVGAYWYDYGDVMSYYVIFTVPIALFMAIHHGIRGNLMPSTAASSGWMTLRSVRWQGMATLGAIWVGVVALSPGEISEKPGARRGIPISLLAKLPPKSGPQISGDKLFEDNLDDLRFEVVELVLLMQRDNTNSQQDTRLSASLSQMQSDVFVAQTASHLIDMLEFLYEEASRTESGYQYLSRIKEIYDSLLALELRAPDSRPDSGNRLSEKRKFHRHEHLEFSLESDGEFQINVSGTVNGFNQDVRLQIHGEWIDRRTGTISEEYTNDKEEKGILTVHADLSRPIISEEDLVSHFIDRMGYFYQAYGILGYGRTPMDERDLGEILFTAEYSWKPTPKSKKSEVADGG